MEFEQSTRLIILHNNESTDDWLLPWNSKGKHDFHLCMYLELSISAVYGQYTAHLQGLTKMSRIIAVYSRNAEFKRVPELDQDEQYTKFDSTLMM